MITGKFDKYDLITAPSEQGYALFRRVADGKIALVKTSWFKPSPDGDGLVPSSRIKALRLSCMEWNKQATTTTETK